MIKFTKADDNKQFISIIVNGNKPIQDVYNYIVNLYPIVKNIFYKMDSSEILLNLLSIDAQRQNNFTYGFSLNQLRQSINKIARCTVTHFSVDLTEPSQRYY